MLRTSALSGLEAAYKIVLRNGPHGDLMREQLSAEKFGKFVCKSLLDYRMSHKRVTKNTVVRSKHKLFPGTDDGFYGAALSHCEVRVGESLT